VGGFGELYVASYLSPDGKTGPEKFVVKVEPHSNGPLFVEVHFYLRATKANQMELFAEKKGLKHLGVPRLVANGSHVKNKQNYRFLVMDRFGSDLQRILDNSEGNKLTLKTTCSVTLQVLDSLEYIHSQGYVHKDVKGSNLLVGLGLDGQHLVHLVDYGLSSKYHVSGLHKQYVHDMRWAHEGTMEYTSRDAHIGCSSRRGDLEVLFYNLIEWLGGSLPWDRECASPQVTKTAKFLAFRQMAKFLRICFRGQKFPMFLLKFMKYVNDLMFEEEPDYDYLRGIVYQEMTSAKIKLDMKLEFKLARLTDPKEELEILNPDLLYGPSKKPPSERVSAVFDTTCVSATSWERQRDDR
jgi:vaccinia related kinase